MTDYISQVNIPNDGNHLFGADITDGEWNIEMHQLLGEYTLAKDATTSIDVSSFIPFDGYAYELLLCCSFWTNSTTNSESCRLQFWATGNPSFGILQTPPIRNQSGMLLGGTVYCPLQSYNRTFNIKADDACGAHHFHLYLTAYKRLGRNNA